LHQFSFPSSNTCYTKPLELVFIDIWGPSHVRSVNGDQYYISFLDAYSRFTWVYLLHSKSQAFTLFLRFKLLVENQLGTRIKAIQTDNAKEFQCFDKFLHNAGIAHRYTCPHTHQQNDSVERKHKHIIETGLSLLAHASLPLKYWNYAFMHASIVINNLLIPVLNNRSPYQVLFGHTLDHNMFKIFGCLCYPLLKPYNNHKFNFKSSACLFLGLCRNRKGYICMHPSGKIYFSRSVLFSEQVFPYKLATNMFETQPTIVPEPTPLPSPNINSPPLPSVITSEKCIVSSIPNVAPQDATATSCSPEKSPHQSNLNSPETDHPTSSPIDQSISP